MIKLIATDIDGTLVKDGTLAIDPEYMEVVGKLVEKGMIFVACSGRQYRSERQTVCPCRRQAVICFRWRHGSPYTGKNLKSSYSG